MFFPGFIMNLFPFFPCQSRIINISSGMYIPGNIKYPITILIVFYLSVLMRDLESGVVGQKGSLGKRVYTWTSLIASIVGHPGKHPGEV